MIRQKVIQMQEQYQLWDSRDTVVVAVSGGPDSMALLHLLHSMSRESSRLKSVHAVHINHGLRGRESDEDETYVHKFCQLHGIPLAVEHVDVRGYRQESGLGIQEAARRLRYQVLERIAAELNAGIVATAHHADDQMETILMRLIRGTGPEGLQGIPVKRRQGEIVIIRPLLTCYKNELEQYCNENQIHPRSDSSNESDKYTRNRIRHRIIPLLREMNPRVGEAFLQLRQIVESENDWMDNLARDLLKEVILEKDQHKIIIQRDLFQKYELPLQRRICKLILSCLFENESGEWTFALIQDVLKVIHSSSPSAYHLLPGGGEIRRRYDHVLFLRESGKKVIAPFRYELKIPGVTYIPELDLTISAKITDELPRMENGKGHRAVFDLDALNVPLMVRTREQGDRIELMHAKGSQKLQDVMINQKIPKDERDLFPVITMENKVIWIPGVKRSGLGLVSTSTEKFLILEVE